MKQRALITGINGFVGKYLTQALQARGWDVLGLGIVPEAGVIPCDITDQAQVQQALQETGAFTHVFHLAAQTFVPAANEAPQASMTVNYGGTVNLLQALEQQTPEARFVYISSADIYGPPRYLPVDETHPVQPPNAYAISKAAADHYCAFFAQATGQTILRLRPFNHSGPGQADNFVLSSFARQIAAIEAGKQEPIMRVGNLEAARDFLHVEDVVSAYVRVAETGASGAVYNVASGSAVRIQEALEYLLTAANTEVTIEQDPARMRPADVPEIRGDATALKRATGWEPRYSFEELLQDLLRYWREAYGKKI